MDPETSLAYMLKILPPPPPPIFHEVTTTGVPGLSREQGIFCNENTGTKTKNGREHGEI